MNDNVIKFRKRTENKPPKQTPPWLRKVLIACAVIAVIAAVYVYNLLTLPS